MLWFEIIPKDIRNCIRHYSYFCDNYCHWRDNVETPCCHVIKATIGDIQGSLMSDISNEIFVCIVDYIKKITPEWSYTSNNAGFVPWKTVSIFKDPLIWDMLQICGLPIEISVNGNVLWKITYKGFILTEYYYTNVAF